MMNIETTINIHRDRLELLSAAARRLGVSNRHVISSIVRLLSLRADINPKALTRIQYQERLDPGVWRTFHVVLRPDEYEFFIDMKKVLKLSVSFIIAEAIDLYLDEIVVLMEQNPDNYRYRNYAIMDIMIEDVRCWVLYWGIPKRILTPPPE